LTLIPVTGSLQWLEDDKEVEHVREQPRMTTAGRPPDSGAAIIAIEEAKRELLTALPSPRGIPARQIADALLAFEERLRQAAEELAAWNDSAGAGVLAAAIAESLRRAERLRLDPPALDYEALVAILADLIEPLGAFAERPIDD